MAMYHVVCLLVLATAVFADEPEKLVSARDTTIGDFPYTVSIRVNGKHFCGGAIIHKQFILTAAHCVYPLMNPDPFVPQEVTIVSGSSSLLSGGQTHMPLMYFRHSKYVHDTTRGRTWFYDVGAIKLAAPMTFNANQRPISLPTSEPPVDVHAVVSAWGATEFPPSRNYPFLQKLDLKLIPRDMCQAYFHEITIQDVMICTLNQANVGTCSGDSGSPLVYDNKLIGVVSGGFPCALGFPDIFTNIYKLMDFVRFVLTQ